MSTIGPGSTVQAKTYLQHDFEVDPDGISYLLSSVFISDEDEPEEIRVLLDDVIDVICEDYGDVNGYQPLHGCPRTQPSSRGFKREGGFNR